MKRYLAIFVLSAAATAIAARPNTAFALFDRQLPASACITTNTINLSGGVISNLSGSASVTLTCPVLNDQSLPKESISNFNVEVYVGGATTVTAQACVAFAAGGGGVCGTAGTASTYGHQTIAPSRSQFTSGHHWDFGYVLVTLPSTGSGALEPSAFYGINMS